jgi:RNA polymerase sigma factor (sigma-70 family)
MGALRSSLFYMHVCNKEDLRLINDKDIISRNQLIEKHYELVQGFMYKNLFDKEMATELTQEVMYKVVANFHKYDKFYPFNCWVHKIAKNHLFDHYKFIGTKKFKEGPRNTNVYDIYNPNVINLLMDNSDIISKIYTYDLINLLKRKAPIIFTKKEIELFHFKFIEDLDNKEISKLLKIPLSKVYYHNENIRNKMKNYLLKNNIL